MSDLTSADKIEQACAEALEKFEKLALPEYEEVKAKLAFVINSYRADGNPVGLYEIGAMALEALKEYKTKKPRQVSKKLVEGLEKALEGQNS